MPVSHIYYLGHSWNAGDGAVLTCDECGAGDLRLTLLGFDHDKAFRAAIAAAKELGWTVAENLVTCDRCNEKRANP